MNYLYTILVISILSFVQVVHAEDDKKPSGVARSDAVELTEEELSHLKYLHRQM